MGWFNDFRDKVEDLANETRRRAEQAVNEARRRAEQLTDELKRRTEEAAELARKAAEEAKRRAEEAAELAKKAAEEAKRRAEEAAKVAAEAAADAEAAAGSVKHGFLSVAGTVDRAATTAWEASSDEANAIGTAIESTGMKIGTGFIDGGKTIQHGLETASEKTGEGLVEAGKYISRHVCDIAIGSALSAVFVALEADPAVVSAVGGARWPRRSLPTRPRLTPPPARWPCSSRHRLRRFPASRARSAARTT
jgi:hypothetical protein